MQGPLAEQVDQSRDPARQAVDHVHGARGERDAGAAGNGEAMVHIVTALVAFERQQLGPRGQALVERAWQGRPPGYRGLPRQHNLQHLLAIRLECGQLHYLVDSGRGQAVGLVDDQDGAVLARPQPHQELVQHLLQLDPRGADQPAVQDFVLGNRAQVLQQQPQQVLR